MFEIEPFISLPRLRAPDAAAPPPDFEQALVSSRPPIVFFAFNRPEHTMKALRALAECPGAADSDLVVFVDGPRSAAEAGECARVAEISRSAVGFRSVTVDVAQSNKGLYRSITEGVGNVLDTRQSAIILEDDLLVEKGFLDYMATALDHYAAEPRVGCIHAYALPIPALPELYFLRGGDCWGWGTWRDRWKLFRPDPSGLIIEMTERGLLRDFMLSHGASSLSMLCDRYLGKNQSWAILWHASLFLADRLTLHPGKSFVTNIGNDGSGTHTANSVRFLGSGRAPQWTPGSALPAATPDDTSALLTSAFMDGVENWSLLRSPFRWYKKTLAIQRARFIARKSGRTAK